MSSRWKLGNGVRAGTGRHGSAVVAEFELPGPPVEVFAASEGLRERLVRRPLHQRLADLPGLCRYGRVKAEADRSERELGAAKASLHRATAERAEAVALVAPGLAGKLVTLDAEIDRLSQAAQVAERESMALADTLIQSRAAAVREVEAARFAANAAAAQALGREANGLLADLASLAGDVLTRMAAAQQVGVETTLNGVGAEVLENIDRLAVAAVA
jgi:hypothetical protein